MMRYPAIDHRFFIANRDHLKVKLKPGSVAFLFSNYQMPRNGDQYFPYRQHSDFFYLTGIEQEKSILILAPDAISAELKEVLFILRANPTLETWEGHKLTTAEAGKISGIKTIKYTDEFDAVIHALMIGSENVYFNLPELPKFFPEVQSKDEAIASQIKEKYRLHRFERLAPLLQQMRLRKSETEIGLMKKAVSITRQALLNVLSNIKPGMKEYEIEAMITCEFIKNGANGHAYSPIIAGGKNACVLHYTENDCICADNDLLLMDFGAEYANYAADLSRTVPVNGRFTRRQRELYEAVYRIFNIARELIKPGTTINKIHDEVCKRWEEEHIRLGLYTRNDVKEHTLENPLWYNYYMHGTIHFLGLDVHDTGTKETVLEPGMVLTCEPGIYIAREGVGIRIENNLLLTENGNIDLMEQIPIHPDEIEACMNKIA
jgi:Xaa-Pro aminopeptidase